AKTREDHAPSHDVGGKTPDIQPKYLVALFVLMIQISLAREGKPGGRLSIMKTLLRRVSTGLYFQEADRWTHDPDEACNFKTIDHALDFIKRWQLRGVELAFCFDNPTE